MAVAPDESIALIVSSTRIDPTDSAKTIFNDEVTEVDLESSPPRVIDTVYAGLRASGVSINASGTLALEIVLQALSLFSVSLVKHLPELAMCKSVTHASQVCPFLRLMVVAR